VGVEVRFVDPADPENFRRVSSISLFDGLPITEFDVLPISASRLL
jgi:hypothetical protein